MGFLSDYLLYASGDEAPSIYHTWSGLSALSSCASRRYWFDHKKFMIQPHLYVILVGSPGAKKSTAMNLAKNLVRDIGKIVVAGTSPTKEAMVQIMAATDSPCRKTFINPLTKQTEVYTHMSVYATELTHFIGHDPLKMIDFLTTIYDEPVYENNTKGAGNDFIQGPCIPLLGCMTPSTTDVLLSSRIIQGGFARRTIFVYAGSSTKAVAFPEVTTEQMDAWNRCVQRGRHISQKLCGPFVWAPDAKEWYIDWYGQLKIDAIRKATPWTEGWFQSKHIQLEKIAMLLALADSDDLRIELNNVTYALRLLDEVEKDLPKIFEGSGRNVQSNVANRILEFVRNRNNVWEKLILREMFSDATPTELREILNHLAETEQIVKFEQTVSGKKGIYYCTPDYATEMRKKKTE